VRAGYEIGYLSTRLRLGAPKIATVKGEVGAARFKYSLDHTDDPVIPRRGFSAETHFRWFDTSPGAAEGFPALEQHVNYFQPVSKGASISF